MDSSRPTLGAFWLELYLERTLGRGLPPLWEQKMLFDATKAHDAYYGDSKGGHTPRPAPHGGGDGGAPPPPSGGSFEAKVLEKLDGMNPVRLTASVSLRSTSRATSVASTRRSRRCSVVRTRRRRAPRGAKRD